MPTITILKTGASGVEVTRLQKRLKARGFDPGFIDGRFGPGTDAAVRAFQASKRLVVDGIAGRQTFKALRLAAPARKFPQFKMDAVTVDIAAEMFPGAPLGNIKASLPSVLRVRIDAPLRDCGPPPGRAPSPQRRDPAATGGLAIPSRKRPARADRATRSRPACGPRGPVPA